MKVVQCILDAGFYIRKFLLDCITFVSIRLFGIECAFADVTGRKYSLTKHTDLNLDHAHDLDTLLDSAKDRFNDSIDRRAFVTDKVKTLLTLTTAFLAILAAFLPRTTEFDSHWAKVAVIAGVFLLVNALIVLWTYFDIKEETVVDLTQASVGLEENDLKKSLVNDYLKCQVGTDNVTDFLADLYKTARFYFLSGFTIIFIVGLFVYIFRSPVSDTERMVRQLRSDPQLIELLRGPKGEQGLQGERGLQGEKGPRGERGETGRSPTIK